MVIVFVTAAVALTCSNFLSDGSNPRGSNRCCGESDYGGRDRLHDAMTCQHRDFNQLAFWAVVVISTYVLPAALCIRFVFHERVRDYGLRVQGIGAHVARLRVLFAIAAR